MAQDGSHGRGPGALFDEAFGAVGCTMVVLVLFAFFMLTLVISGFLTALRPYSFVAIVIPVAAFAGWRAYRRRRGR